MGLLQYQLTTDLTIRYQRSISSQPAPSTRRSASARANHAFEPSKYSTRLIALKFAYLGQSYNGLEYHAKNKTPLPTVEEVIWKALMKARLIFPTPVEGLESEEVNWEGCEYSKCGRTDKGVSAFGQVIGLRVRSNRPLVKEELPNGHEEAITYPLSKDGARLKDQELAISRLETSDDGSQNSSHSTETSKHETRPFDPVNDEIPYPQVLNRLLPPDVRVLAWCPSPPKDFSARFSCKERRYKYFFTQPAFSPTISPDIPSKRTNDSSQQSRREGWLNIRAMQVAAESFVGLHDFRNFCKVDASKQIENFERRIFRATIDELDPRISPMGYLRRPEFAEYSGRGTTIDGRSEAPGPKIFTFTLHGSAFLWHQVRHMVGILFLIGQGLESPSLVSELLDVKKYPQKPQYEMADDAPLVLWDCIFPEEDSDSEEDALDWVCVGDFTGGESEMSQTFGGTNGKYGLGGVIDEMWKVWRQRKIDEVLAGSLLDVIAGCEQSTQGFPKHPVQKANFRGSQKVFAGADGARLVGKYIPVLKKPRMESVEIINSRYIKRKMNKDEDIKKPN